MSRVRVPSPALAFSGALPAIATSRPAPAARPFDIQVNGYAGADFCSAVLTREQCRMACDALAADGVDGILATVITDSIEAVCAKLARLVAFRNADPVIAKMIAGFHVEGPFISPEPGFVGAHAREHVLPATPEAMRSIPCAARSMPA